MECYFWFLSILAVSIFCCGGISEDAANKVLTRKRRYLAFPEGSTFVVTLSNTKGLMWDVPTFGRPPWNSIIEFDLVFKLPNMTELLPNYKIASGEYDGLNQSHYQHRRDRRQFYRQMEDVLDLQGEDGRMCLYRALCEAKHLLKPGRSFIEDILLILFTFSRGNGEDAEGYETAWGQESCKPWSAECSYSLLRQIIS